VLGDDGLALRLPAGQVDVGRAWGLVLVEAYFGVRVDRAEGYDLGALPAVSGICCHDGFLL
jgi:hypothetical protein